MGLSVAKRTRLWQEQGSVDPPIDAIGLDWGLYRAGPLIEAEILTPISSRYNGELDAAMRRGASLHKKMLPMKMVDEPSAARTGVSSLPERRNPQWFGDHFLLSTLFGHEARDDAGCRYNLLISVPLGSTAKALAVEGMQPGRVGRLDDN